MTLKKKRSNSIVEIGTGLAKVSIHPLNRMDGWSETRSQNAILNSWVIAKVSPGKMV